MSSYLSYDFVITRKVNIHSFKFDIRVDRQLHDSYIHLWNRLFSKTVSDLIFVSVALPPTKGSEKFMRDKVFIASKTYVNWTQMWNSISL